MQRIPRYFDTEAYLYDEAYEPTFEETLYSPAPAPVAIAPASDPVAIAPAPAPDPVAVATAPAFNWQPGQAWDPARTESFTYGGDLYMPGFETDWMGQQQLTGLTRFIGGKQPEPGQTVYTESLDPMTGKPIPGLQVMPLTAYKVDPRGGTFWEAFMGALPMLAPIGAYAMGIGATGASGLADLAGGSADLAGQLGGGSFADAGLAARSALDAGMDVYPALDFAAPSALDAGMDVYQALDLGTPSALDAGMDVYPATEFTPPSALDAGMDVYPATEFTPPSALDAGMDVYPSAPEDPTSPEYVRTSADRAAQYGKEGYGPPMSGTQTSAYDKVLELTGSKELADLAARAAGGASGLEDLIKNKVKDELKKTIAPEKTQQQNAAKSGADLLSMLGIMGLLSNQRQQEAPTPLFQAGPALDLAALFGHTPTRRG